MGRVPILFAHQGCVGAFSIATIAGGLTAVAAVAIVAVLIIKARKKSAPQTALKTTAAPSQKSPSLDSQLIRSLSRDIQERLPSIPDDFSITGAWLNDDVLQGVFDGDGELFGRLLREIIDLSKGRFIPVTAVGDLFDGKCMHTWGQVPKDRVIKSVIWPGLKKASDGDVLIKAEVEF